MTSPPLLDSSEAIRRHLRAIAPDEERRRPGVWFMMCDDQSRGLVLSPIDNLPASPTAEECRHCVSVFAGAVASEPGGGLLLLILRPAPASVTPLDRQWFHAMYAECAEHGVRPLGVWLATPGVERELVLDDML